MLESELRSGIVETLTNLLLLKHKFQEEKYCKEDLMEGNLKRSHYQIEGKTGPIVFIVILISFLMFTITSPIIPLHGITLEYLLLTSFITDKLANLDLKRSSRVYVPKLGKTRERLQTSTRLELVTFSDTDAALLKFEI